MKKRVLVLDKETLTQFVQINSNAPALDAGSISAFVKSIVKLSKKYCWIPTTVITEVFCDDGGDDDE